MALLITFEFLGGFMDGRTLSNDKTDFKEREETENFYHVFTDGGKIGSRFAKLSDAAWEQLEVTIGGGGKLAQRQYRHIYEVVERLEEDDHVLVRMKYVGPKE